MKNRLWVVHAALGTLVVSLWCLSSVYDRRRLFILTLFATALWVFFSIVPSLTGRLVSRGKSAWAVLACVILFAFAIRWPHLDRPLSDGHEWVTAQSLMALENWELEGGLSHRFCLTQTYPGEQNLFVKDESVRLLSPEGRGYYTSFPPFSIILPSLCFKALSLEVSALHLQLFNLLLHSLTAFLIFAILRMSIARGEPNTAAALFGSALYLLGAPFLWYFSNVYSWDTFWHFPWALGIYLAVRLRKAGLEGTEARRLLIGLGTLNFFLVYSEFQGSFFALSLILYLLFRKNGGARRWTAMAVLASTSCAAVVLTVAQYSTIAGLEPFLEALREKGDERSFLNASTRDVLVIARHYVGAYPGVIVAMGIAALVAFGTRGSRGNETGEYRWFASSEIFVLYLAIFPVALHHLLLLEWTMRHDYSILKSCIAIPCLAAILLHRATAGRAASSIGSRLATAAMLAALVSSVATYETVYTYSKEGETRFRELGEEIRARADDKDVVFAHARCVVTPQITYYSKRNILTVESRKEALDWLAEHGRTRGVLFHIGEEASFESAESLAIEEGPS